MFIHYNYKYDWLRPAIEEIVEMYKKLYGKKGPDPEDVSSSDSSDSEEESDEDEEGEGDAQEGEEGEA